MDKNILENFLVCEQDNLRLIIPTRVTAISNSAWNKDNLWLRSRVETLDGKTVSQGFSKFWNIGTGTEGFVITAADIAQAITNDDAIATIKLDGSLLIRSVHEGKIILRTRGSFGYEHLDNAWEIDKIFKQKYPRLWDVTFCPNSSLLFEWTTPNNQIVIKYQEPELTLIGAVQHWDMKYTTIEGLDVISNILQIPLVQWYKLDSQGFHNLMQKLAIEKNIEGWVVRINNEQTLVKIKCDHYLALHRLKSNLTINTMLDLWFEQGCPEYVQFVKNMEEQYDEETVVWMMPVISALMDAVKILNSIVTEIKNRVQTALQNQSSRKDFALAMLKQYGKSKKFALAMEMFSDCSLLSGCSGKVSEVIDLLGKPKNVELLKDILLQNMPSINQNRFSLPQEEN